MSTPPADAPATASKPQRLREIARFLIGGASTTGVSYLLYLAMLPFLGYVTAYTIAFVAGIAWSYVVNTLFVFRRRPSLGRALAFPLVYAVQYAVGAALLIVLVSRLDVPRSVAPLVTVVLTLPLTFALSRWIITHRR